MDGEPPPLEDVAEFRDERQYVFTLEDEDDASNALPLPDRELIGTSETPSRSELPRDFSEPTSIPEYTPAWDEETHTQLKSVIDEEAVRVLPVKKAVPMCNGHVDDTPTLSGISETMREDMEEISQRALDPETPAVIHGTSVLNGMIEESSPGLSSANDDSGHHEPTSPSPIESLLEADETQKNDEPETIAHPPKEAEEDEFGDFADIPTSSSAAVPPRQEDSTQASGDTAWSAFSGGTSNDNSLKNASQETWAAFEVPSSAAGDSTRASVDEEWGDFGVAPASATNSGGEKQLSRASINEDDDWDETDFVSAPAPPKTEDGQILPILHEKPCVPSAFDELRMEEEEDDSTSADPSVFCLRDTLDREQPETLVSELVARCTEIWLALRIVEEAISLRHQFPDSILESVLHKALHVDKTFVRPPNPSQTLTDAVLVPTPISAVEASRGGRPVTVAAGSSSVFTASQSSSVNTPSDNNLKNPMPNSKPTATSDQRAWFSRRSLRFWSTTERVGAARSKSASPPAFKSHDSLSVPPADFNWEGSGLTNPLKAKGTGPSASLLDVDFFASSSGPMIVSSASVLEKDLDALGLSSGEGATMKREEPKNPGQLSKTGMLSSLLGGMHLGARPSSDRGGERSPRPAAMTTVSELSLDARALHDQLPDIEFLKSRLIMFPFGHMGGTSSTVSYPPTPKK